MNTRLTTEAICHPCNIVLQAHLNIISELNSVGFNVNARITLEITNINVYDCICTQTATVPEQLSFGNINNCSALELMGSIFTCTLCFWPASNRLQLLDLILFPAFGIWSILEHSVSSENTFWFDLFI